MNKLYFIILICIIGLVSSIPVDAQETVPTKEEIHQYITREVERIYTQEGGKRSKELIAKEVIKRGLVRAQNDMMQQALDSGNPNSGRLNIQLYETTIANVPDFAGVGILPEEAKTMHLAGDIERETGHYTEALTYYNRAITIDPNYFSAYYYKGAIYWGTKQCSLSYVTFKKASEIDPTRFWTETPAGKIVTAEFEKKSFPGKSKLELLKMVTKYSCEKEMK